MARPAPLRRLVAGAIAANLLVACSTAGDPMAGLPSPSAAAPSPTLPTLEPGHTLEPSSTPRVATSDVPSAAATSVSDAAARFLASDSATFELVVTRFKPELPDEVTAVAAGVVDPAGDRGRMRFELFPNDPDDSPFALGPIDIAWNPTDYWTTAGPEDPDRAWQHTTRARAPGMALIGRVNEEPLALVRLAASADPEGVEVAPPARLAGEPAQHWLISVPADAAGESYVPPETYLAFSQVFGRPDLPLEVWLVDGRIARVGYVLEREKAPYGGPDRIETWYDWSATGDPMDLVLPPPGEIEEIHD